jgi:HSP20 family protein
MAVVRWNPARELLNIEREFGRMFNNFEKKFGFGNSGEERDDYENAVWSPLTDISENKENYVLKMDLPGIDKKDVKISYSDGQLNISGERKMEKEEKDSRYHRVERLYGKYYRSFSLPDKVKESLIDAEFKDGQLTITVPKSEEVKPKELEIKVK